MRRLYKTTAERGGAVRGSLREVLRDIVCVNEA